MNRSRLMIFFLMILLLMPVTKTMADSSVPSITVDDLAAKLGEPGVRVIDVRRSGQYDADETRIKGALRMDTQPLEWATRFPKNEVLIFYCA